MPWTERSAMDLRLCFIAAHTRDDVPFGALCARYGISRMTGYKWVGRYRAFGAAGLADRSRARLDQLLSMLPETSEAVLALRERHPSWGPRKLLARLAMDHPGQDWPAASTIGDLLRREGVSMRRRTGRRHGSPPPALIEPLAPNDTWSADFKGWWRTRDGVRFEPFTVTDGFSRFILACEALARLTTEEVIPVLTRLFQMHGLPGALRTDNGSPFASRRGLAGLSRLSVWLLKQEVWPDRIAPGRPDRNGRHERMHRVLGEDTARPPAATVADRQLALDIWRVEYNTLRPHEALGQICPASVYVPSPRPWVETTPVWDYPLDHHVRRVDAKGYVRWRDNNLYLTEALHGETVALARRDDGNWRIRFRGFDLAVLSETTNEVLLSGLSRTAAASPKPMKIREQTNTAQPV